MKAALDAQEKEVADLQREWDKVNGKVDEYDLKIQRSREEIERNTVEVGRLRAKLGKGGKSVSGYLNEADKSAKRFGKRMLSIGASAFVFNVISDGLRGAVGYMGKILKTNKEYTAQLAKLKAALLTAFQPIYEFVLPGLIMVLKILTAILTMFGKFLSWMFGKKYSDMVQNAESLYKEAHVTSLTSRNSTSSFGGYFAKGGTLRSGWGIVGEAGPEIVQIVNGHAVITPLDIPYLAQGAVLPANKPFMAMVGDQRHGTNIEAPLSTIQEAVGLVMADQLSAMMAGFEAVVQAIQEKNTADVIGDSDIGEANARYSRRMAIRRGV